MRINFFFNALHLSHRLLPQTSKTSMAANITKLMMANLIEAWGDNRLRCSSSRGVFKQPTARFVDHNTLQLTAEDSSFTCSVSPMLVTLVIDGTPQVASVNANSFGDNGARSERGALWIQVSCRCHDKDVFWLELYAPSAAARGIAAERGSMLQRA